MLRVNTWEVIQFMQKKNLYPQIIHLHIFIYMNINVQETYP